MAAFDRGLVEAVAQTAYRSRIAVQSGEGYVAPPLSGIWASAPYLYNGSVPTLAMPLDPLTRTARLMVGGPTLLSSYSVALWLKCLRIGGGHRAERPSSAVSGVSSGGRQDPAASANLFRTTSPLRSGSTGFVAPGRRSSNCATMA